MDNFITFNLLIDIRPSISTFIIWYDLYIHLAKVVGNAVGIIQTPARGHSSLASVGAGGVCGQTQGPHSLTEGEGLRQDEDCGVGATVDWASPAGVNVDCGDGDNLGGVSSVMGPDIHSQVTGRDGILHTVGRGQHMLLTDQGAATQKAASYVKVHNPGILIRIGLIAPEYSAWLVGNSTITNGACRNGGSVWDTWGWGHGGCFWYPGSALCAAAGIVWWKFTTGDIS